MRFQFDKVVLIDSGVSAEHPHLLGRARILPLASLGLDGRLVREAPQTDRLGHGTCAAAAIADHAPGVTIASIQVFGDHPTAPFERILEALEIACELKRVLVNLSLGTTDPSYADAIEGLVRRLLHAGSRLVAPISMGGMPSFPGCVDGVVAVRPDPSVPRGEFRKDSETTRTIFCASPYPRPVPGVPEWRNLRGVSFAVANVVSGLMRRDDA